MAVPVKPILNPEPGRFICQGPSAATNAEVLAGFERDRGLKAVVLRADREIYGRPEVGFEVYRQATIAEADVIIDVIE
jgi:hypothetical protein